MKIEDVRTAGMSQKVGHSPQQAHNQSDSTDIAGLHQVNDVVVFCRLLLLLLLLINLQGSRNIHSEENYNPFGANGAPHLQLD